MKLKVSYWIPRQYSITIDAADLRDAVSGTADETETARILAELESGRAGSIVDTERLAGAIEEHAQYLFSSDDEHQVDSDAAQDFSVELADGSRG
jgi:hypothetical protein